MLPGGRLAPGSVAGPALRADIRLAEEVCGDEFEQMLQLLHEDEVFAQSISSARNATSKRSRKP